jgi:hypothetical protein
MGGGAAGGRGHGPFGDRVVSSEVLVGPARAVGDEQSIELDDLAGPGRLEALRQALACALPISRKRRPPGFLRRIGTGLTAPRAMRLLRMRPTVEVDTVKPWRTSSMVSLALPTSDCRRARLRPHQPQHRSPARLAWPMRPAAPQDGLLGPAIERRARHADCLSCGFGVEPEFARPLAVSDSVASDRRCDIWGLRVDETRREPGGSDTWPGRPNTCIGGPSLLLIRHHQLRSPPIPSQGSSSHICLNPDSRGYRGCR